MRRLSLFFLMILFSSLSRSNDLESAKLAVTNMWEYSRDDYNSAVLFTSEEKLELLSVVSESKNVDLVKAINCIKPAIHYSTLYQYRCGQGGIEELYPDYLNDFYVLSFVKKKDQKVAIKYLKEYLNFLDEVAKIGMRVDVGDKERVLEILKYLESGGLVD